MGSHTETHSQTVGRYNKLDLTDEQKKQLSDYFNNLGQDRQQFIDYYKQWSNPEAGSIQDKLRKTALGENLNYVNPYEQKMLDDSIDQRNHDIQRTIDAAGRLGSSKNYEAIANNTDSMRNQFMANNINRNRAEQQAAINEYLGGLSNSIGRQQGIDLSLPSILRQYINSYNTDTQSVTEKRSNLSSILGGIGSIIPIIWG